MKLLVLYRRAVVVGCWLEPALDPETVRAIDRRDQRLNLSVKPKTIDSVRVRFHIPNRVRHQKARCRVRINGQRFVVVDVLVQFGTGELQKENPRFRLAGLNATARLVERLAVAKCSGANVFRYHGRVDDQILGDKRKKLEFQRRSFFIVGRKSDGGADR